MTIHTKPLLEAASALQAVTTARSTLPALGAVTLSFYDLLTLQRANPNDYGVARAIEERDAFHDAARHRNTMDWNAAQQRRRVLRDHGLSL